MSDSEDDISSIRDHFDRTTIQLISEYIKKSSTSSELLKSKSFKKFVRHLNPLASIPTVSDIEQKDEVRVRNASCLVCQCENPIDDVTLSLDHAAIILIGESSKPNFEVARRLQSTSLRMCHSHIPEVFKKMFQNLKIETTENLKNAKLGVLEEYRSMFLEIKKLDSGEKQENLDTIKFYNMLQNFVGHFYESPETTTSRPAEPVKLSAEESENEEDDENEEEQEEEEEEEEYPGPSSKYKNDNILDPAHPKRRALERPPVLEKFERQNLRLDQNYEMPTLMEPKEESTYAQLSCIDDVEEWPTASSYLSSNRYKSFIKDARTTTRTTSRNGRELAFRRQYSPF